MTVPAFLRRRRWQAVVALGGLICIVAVFGGFSRSDHPLPTIAPGDQIELGQFAFVIDSARIVDVDDDDEPFEDGMPRVIVSVKLSNISDETTSFGEGLIGVYEPHGKVYVNKTESSSFHPDLEREVEISVPVPASRLPHHDGKIDVWLGARTFGWTNLALAGPAWSVPNWAAIATDVPVSDERGGV